jgi:hypothetical protein
MKRLVLSLSVTLALAACSVAPRSAWTFDPTHPQARAAADPAAIAPLTNRIAALQNDLNDVRARIAAQPDAEHRLPLYPEEHRIARELSPLQRELAQYAQAR